MKKLILIIALIAISSTNGFSQSIDLKSGLVAFYPFNGNANDESGNGNNGYVNGATLTNDRNGVKNSAYYFNGYDAKIYFNTNSSSINSNTYSIFAWIKTSNPGSSYRGIIVKQLAVGLFLKDNELMSYDWQYRVDKKSNSYIADNSWHLIGLVLNNGTIKFYKDGRYINSSSFTINNQSENFIIGTGGYKQEDQYYKGSIDDVRIYNRAISENEIQAIYSEQTETLKPPTISWINPNNSYNETSDLQYTIKATIKSDKQIKSIKVMSGYTTLATETYLYLSNGQGTFEKEITLSEGNNEITIIAENEDGSSTSTSRSIK